MSLEQTNVLVGPNNAGKSTVLDAFRILSSALRFARRRNPTAISLDGQTVLGWEIPAGSLPVALNNIHSDLKDSIATKVSFALDSKRVDIHFEQSARCFMTVEKPGKFIRTTTDFKREIPAEIAFVPTLGPFEQQEEYLTDDYVNSRQNTRFSHRLFRNIWYRNRQTFEEFQALVETTWPGMSVAAPQRVGYGPGTIEMFYMEGRKPREISWAGFGFQVWLQMLTYLIQSSSATTLIVDEPEIYLHPDLQHTLFRLLKETKKQLVLATHSVEIINEAEHREVVTVNRARRVGRRVSDVDGLQEALFSIGSAQNIHLSRLSRSRKVLFLEGRDYKLLKRFAKRIGLSALADETNITVVPIGGFTQKQRIQDAAWTFEKVLRAEIHIAALLDRDYRCQEEVDDISRAMGSSISNFFILGMKEIENYLLKPLAIAAAINERMREAKGNSFGPIEISDIDVTKLLLECTDEFKSDVAGQLIANRTRYTTKGNPIDVATVTSETIKHLESMWGRALDRMKIVPGKETLTYLNFKLQSLFHVSVTPTQIIRLMPKEEIDDELRVILSELNAFAAR